MPQAIASRRLIIAGCVVGLLALGLTFAGRPYLERATAPTVGTGGLQANLSLEQLVRAADLIVVGTAETEAVRPFTSNAAIPREAKDRIYSTGSYHDVTVKVDVYLKGQGPEALSVRRLASSPGVQFENDAPAPRIGERDVLLLFRGEGVWTGGYLVLGPRGLAPVDGSTIHFPGFGDVDISELRRVIQDASRPSSYQSGYAVM